MDTIIIIILSTIIFFMISIIIILITRKNSNSNHSNYPTQNQLTVDKAKALVLTCIDFRLIDDIVRFMNKLGYNNNYDKFIISGASLGYNKTDKLPFSDAWRQTIDTHISLAMNLHEIKEVIVIDHMKCDAYKKYYKPDGTDLEESEEITYHIENLKTFGESIQDKYPCLGVKCYLMNLDSSINFDVQVVLLPLSETC
jgi:carbonic anhydrase